MGSNSRTAIEIRKGPDIKRIAHLGRYTPSFLLTTGATSKAISDIKNIRKDKKKKEKSKAFHFQLVSFWNAPNFPLDELLEIILKAKCNWVRELLLRTKGVGYLHL